MLQCFVVMLSLLNNQEMDDTLQFMNNQYDDTAMHRRQEDVSQYMDDDL